MEFKESQIVLCTVDRIQGTTVFVKIEEDGEGTIVTSEIAPGRIRNIRDYVVPGKKIVCKILKIEGKNINLSLRRVAEKEKKEILEKYEKEKSSLSILKSVAKEKAQEAAEKIKKQGSLHEFLQKAKENQKLLEKYFAKEEAEKIFKILKEKKEKEKEIKKEFSLKSNLPDGITRIKNALSHCKENIVYLAAGRFLIKIKSENYKKANQEAEKILQEIENKAKKEKLEFQAEK